MQREPQAGGGGPASDVVSLKTSLHNSCQQHLLKHAVKSILAFRILHPAASTPEMTFSVCFDALGTCFTLDSVITALEEAMGDRLGPGVARMVILDWVRSP